MRSGRTRARTVSASPIDPARLAIELEAAVDREQVFALLLRAARSRAPYVALLSVHKDELLGRRAIAGDGPDASSLGEMRIPRQTVPAFEEAIASGFPYIGPLTGDPWLAGLVEHLGGSVPSSAMVLPVAFEERTVALVVGHRGDQALTRDDVSDLFPLLTTASATLSRVLSSRAQAAAPKPGRRSDEATGVAAQRRLLEVYREYESWEELADAVRALIRTGMESGDPDEDEQLKLLVELGAIESEQLGHPELAIEAWRSAQAIDGADPQVIERLERIFVAEARWQDFLDLLERRAALSDDVQEKIGLHLNVAAFALEECQDAERAISAYRRILGWEPGHAMAAEKLALLYREHARWGPLGELLLEQAMRDDDPRTRVAALEAAAEMYEERAGDPRAAFLVWIAVLRREPERTGLVEVLDRLAQAADAWPELVEETQTLAGELETGHPATAAELWRQVARWQRDRLGIDPAAALARAVRLDPDDRATLDELIDARRAAGPWPELAADLGRRLALESEPLRRAELSLELATVHERLGATAEAVRGYQDALAAEPACRPAMNALRRLYRTDEAWEGLAEILAQIAGAVTGKEPRAELLDLHLELGLVLDHLGRAEQAARAFRDALALDPKCTAAYHGLQEVHRGAGQHEPYLEACEAELDATAGAEKARRYAEVAAGWEDRGRFDRAAAAWEKLLFIEPAHLAAHQGLARSLARGERWPELAGALRAQLKLVSGPERIALLVELATVLEGRLGDAEGAIAACEEAAALAPDHRGVLDALARLYQRVGRWKDALGQLERLGAGQDARTRAELAQRQGRIHAERRDHAGAVASFRAALDLDPGNGAALEGLARVQREQGELAPAARRLVEAARHFQAHGDAVRCLVDAAAIYRELGDGAAARACLENVLALEAEHPLARSALAEILHGAGEWQALWPHLEELARRAQADASLPAAERHDAFVRAGRCAAGMGQPGRAVELFDLALGLVPADVPLLVERAAALLAAGDAEGAIKAYQRIVVHQTVTRAESAHIHRQVATIHRQLGRMQQAAAYFGKVLEVDPHDRGALEALCELQLEAGRVDEAIASLRTLAQSVPPEEKPAVLERQADLQRERLGNHGRAVSLYLDAVELDPRNHRVLQKLLDLQSETGQWKAALETIARFVALDDQPARQASYHAAAASIRQFKLKDEAGALDAYEQAVEGFLTPPLDDGRRTRAFEAFRAFDEIVTAKKDWQREERAYRGLLKRLPKEDPALVALWHALGEIYRTRLDQPDAAITAYETAHELDPAKPPLRVQILAELYARTGRAAPERASRLVETNPDSPDAYRAIGRAALAAGRLDEAWCVCRALVLLGQATDEEQALYQRHQEHERRKAKGVLDEDSWALVRDDAEDRLVTSIFALVWEAPVGLRSGPAKSFELKPKDRLDVEDRSRVMAKIFQSAARVLNAPLPHVYTQPQRSGRLLLANCVEGGRLEPTLIVGRDLMTGYKDTEIAFWVASTLALLRPAYYLRLALSSVEELEAVLLAAAQVFGKKLPVRPELRGQVETFAAEIHRRLTPSAAEMLRDLVGRLPGPPDLTAWSNAVDAAARRAGLLVCGELASAIRAISTEPTRPGGPRTADKVRDLVVYSVSPPYFAARRQLGLAIS